MGASLHSYLRHADIDPQRLTELDERMSQWMGLARRYKRPPAELPALLKDWKASLHELDAASDLDRLQASESASAKAYQGSSTHAFMARAKAAIKTLRLHLSGHAGLGMEGGKFEVSVSKAAEPSPDGIDDVVSWLQGTPA